MNLFARLIAALVLLQALVAPAGAAVIQVTSSSDSGAGSLRAAINQANSTPGVDVIQFNIPGSCPRTIALGSALPAIIESLAINGYTQPGAQQNTDPQGLDSVLCIRLANGSANSLHHGLYFLPREPDTDGLVVSGLSIGGFDRGILVEGGSFDLIGNFIGVAPDGVTAVPNGVGVSIRAASDESGTHRIGGNQAAYRNLVSANIEDGIAVDRDGVQIVDNLIGTDRSGNAALGNEIGILFNVNATGEARDNTISANALAGVRVLGGGVQLVDNRIGVKRSSQCLGNGCALGNGLGVAVEGNAATSASIDRNLIGFNGDAGVVVLSQRQYIHISKNRFRNNGELAIDLGWNGVDPIDNDTMPGVAANRGLNHPTLDDAQGMPGQGVVSGRLLSINGSYRIELYRSSSADPSGYGEGEVFLASHEVSIGNALPNQNGSVEFALPITWVGNLVGDHITAIAIDNDNGHTSEFGNAVEYVFDDTIFVNGFEMPVLP